MKTVFEYFDYRKLLKDLYNEQKGQNRYFSYRALGELAGFASAGFFTKILAGTVNISSKTALAFAKAFCLTKIETRYFELLVMFNQAKTHEERRYYFEQLISMRRTKVKELTSEQYELFSEWYYVVIRELLEFYPFEGNFRALGNMLQPSIQPTEAKHAIETLVRLGLVRLRNDGRYEKTDEAVTTGESWISVAITNFQMKTSDLAKQALEEDVSKDLREISTLTVSISDNTFETMKEKIQALRRELLELAKKDTKADRVYHANFHFFPATRIFDGFDPEKEAALIASGKKKRGRGRPPKLR